jgi:hypothetical protein
MIDDFALLRKNNFGIAGVSSTMMKPVTFYNELLAATPGSVVLGDILAKAFVNAPERYHGGFKSQTIIYVNWAILCLRLLELGIDSVFPQDAWDLSIHEGRFCGFTWEDWNRAMNLGKYALRERLGDRGARGSRELSHNRNIAVLPHYVTEEDLTNILDDDDLSGSNEADDDAEKKNRRWEHRFWIASRALEEAVPQPGPEITTALTMDAKTASSKTFLRNVELLESTLAKTFQTNSRVISLPSTRIKRPRISQKDVLTFCADQGQRAKVLWGVEDIDNMRRESIDQITQAPINLSDMWESCRAIETAPEGVETDDLPAADPNEDPTDPAQDPQLRLIWDVKRAMGTQSAPIPSFKTACEWASVDPSNLVIKEAPPYLDEHGNEQQYKYKTHQLPSRFDSLSNVFGSTPPEHIRQGPLPLLFPLTNILSQPRTSWQRLRRGPFTGRLLPQLAALARRSALLQ